MELFKQWNKSTSKSARLTNRRVFLHKCKEYGVHPNHISNNTRGLFSLFGDGNQGIQRKVTELNLRLGLKIINLEISHVNYQLSKISKLKSSLKSKLQQVVPQYITQEFERRQKIYYSKIFHSVKVNNLNKFERLKHEQKLNFNIQDKWLVNLSQTNLPENVKTILSLGPKFSFKTNYKDIHMGRLVSDLESLLNLVNAEKRDFYRAKLTSIITGYVHQNKEIKNPTDKLFRETECFLKENQNLVVVNSDKGGVTVVLDREQYHQKMMDLLSDANSFVVLSRDPTAVIQTKSNDFIKQLEKIQHLTPEQAKTLKIYNASCPKIYGNPKVHKPGAPLRPIVSSIQSPMTHVAQLLCDILTKSYDRNNPYFIADTFGFVDSVKGMDVPLNHEVVSLDVTNLFGNISGELAMEVLGERWESIDPQFICPKIRDINKRKDLFMKMLQFIFDNNYFAYNDTYYKQVFGCAMGSTLSPILAQYVMDHLLDTCLPRLSFNVIFIKKFVDDLILILPTHGLDEIQAVFNAYNLHIKFTVEREIDGGVPFLDTRVIRQNNHIILDWYQKPMASGKYINYLSNHTTKIKINFIKQMKLRIQKISHPSFLNKNLSKLKQLLIQNSYPKALVNKILYSTSGLPLEGRTQVGISVGGNDERPMETRGEGGDDIGMVVLNKDADPINDSIVLPRYGSLPSITGLTSKLIRTFNSENIKIAIRNIKKGSNLFTKLKSKTPIKLKSNVVYSLKCSTCENIYVGQTSQWIKSRLALHKSDITKRRDRCALANHVFKNNHVIDWDGVKILEVECNTNKRLILEMYHISRINNPINKKSDTQQLSNIYTYLLSQDLYTFED